MGLFGKKKEQPKTTPPENYLAHLNRIFQQEPIFFKEESRIPGIPGISVIVYRDIPEKGFVTAFTYGLSLVDHPDWKLGRPELCISVASPSLDWAHAAGFLANKLRGDCPFTYGLTINFRERISEDSEMDAFFIFAPATLHREDYHPVDIGAEYKISITGLYPMYSSELEVFQAMGLKDFWHHPDFDIYSVNRKKISTGQQ